MNDFYFTLFEFQYIDSLLLEYTDYKLLDFQ